MDAKKCSWVGSALLVGPRAAISAHPATTPVVSASPQSHRFLRSSISDLARRSLTHHANVPPGLIRRPPYSFAACSFAPQHPLSTYLTQTQAVGVWHALLLDFWPSGLLAFWRPLYTLQDERILRSLLILLYLRSGSDEWASVWAQGMLLAGRWALCTS